MADITQKFIFKITLVGDGRVGKTSLIKKFTKGSFKKDYIKTIGAQFSVFDKKIESDNIRLLFWDIAGQDDFHFLRYSFFKNSKAAIIVYSLEENELGEESFNHIPNWHNEITEFCPDIPIVVFANKVDLVNEDNINKSKIQGMVNDRNFLGYYLTSAKTGEGVYDAFDAIIDELYQKYKTLSSEI